jgi:hypothetical protein
MKKENCGHHMCHFWSTLGCIYPHHNCTCTIQLPLPMPCTKIMPTHFTTLGQTWIVTTKYIIHEPLNWLAHPSLHAICCVTPQFVSQFQCCDKQCWTNGISCSLSLEKLKMIIFYDPLTFIIISICMVHFVCDVH